MTSLAKINSISDLRAQEMKILELQNREKIDLIKRTVCAGRISDDEFELFMHTCQRTGLDPLMRQIYSVPRGPSRTIQIGIDGFRLIAERTGRYAPGQDATYEYDEKGKLLRATVYLKKMTADGIWHDLTGSVSLKEYLPEKPTPLWNRMPEVMLSKCAEARALRRAFPNDLSGLYIHEEMAQSGKTIDAEVDVEPVQEIVHKQEVFSEIDEQEEDMEKLASDVIKSLSEIENFEQISSDDMISYLEKWRSKTDLFPRLNQFLRTKEGKRTILMHFLDSLRKEHSLGNC